MKLLMQYKFSEWTMVIMAMVIYTVFAWLVLDAHYMPHMSTPVAG